MFVFNCFAEYLFFESLFNFIEKYVVYSESPYYKIVAQFFEKCAIVCVFFIV